MAHVQRDGELNPPVNSIMYFAGHTLFSPGKPAAQVPMIAVGPFATVKDVYSGWGNMCESKNLSNSSPSS